MWLSKQNCKKSPRRVTALEVITQKQQHANFNKAERVAALASDNALKSASCKKQIATPI